MCCLPTWCTAASAGFAGSGSVGVKSREDPTFPLGGGSLGCNLVGRGQHLGLKGTLLGLKMPIFLRCDLSDCQRGAKLRRKDASTCIQG